MNENVFQKRRTIRRAKLPTLPTGIPVMVAETLSDLDTHGTEPSYFEISADMPRYKAWLVRLGLYRHCREAGFTFEHSRFGRRHTFRIKGSADRLKTILETYQYGLRNPKQNKY